MRATRSEGNKCRKGQCSSLEAPNTSMMTFGDVREWGGGEGRRCKEEENLPRTIFEFRGQSLSLLLHGVEVAVRFGTAALRVDVRGGEEHHARRDEQGQFESRGRHVDGSRGSSSMRASKSDRCAHDLTRCTLHDVACDVIFFYFVIISEKQSADDVP